LNSNDHINILLSRKVDENFSVKDRVLFAQEKNADLFISIHVNKVANNEINGFSVLIDKNNSEQNQVLASALINELKSTYKTNDKIEMVNRSNNIWVLDKNVCPAALLELGNMTNSSDAKFISNSADQEKIARNILNAINNYAASLKNGSDNSVQTSGINTLTADTIPVYDKGKKVKTLAVRKTKKDDYSFVGFTDKLYITGSSSKPFSENSKITANAIYIKSIPDDVLIVADGKEISGDEMKDIPPNSMRSINILKGETAEKKYGTKGKNGAIEIITKRIEQDTPITKTYFKFADKDTTPNKIYTKVETEASFPGGPSAWLKYITRQIQASIDTFTNADYGTCVVRFIVNTDGTVTDVQATTMKGTMLAKVSVNAIKKGPKWIPASQNGRTVTSYRLQPVTLTNPEKPKSIQLNLNKSSESTSSTKANDKKEVFLKLQEPKVFLKLEQPASFPGGQVSWLKYLSRVLDKNGNELMSDEKNQGTCEVRFVVSKDGDVSNVHALTMKETKLADVAVNAIKKGPMWIAGKQNGRKVNSLVTVPITFKLSDNIVNKNEPE